MKRIVTLFLLLILVGQGAMAQNKKEQIAILQHSVDSLTGRIGMLEQQLAQRTEENGQLTQKLAAAMQNVEQLEQSLRESKDAQLKLQREMDARVAELNHQIDSLRDQLLKLQTSTIENNGVQYSEFEEPNIPAGYQIVDKYSISGHSQYAYAIVLSKGDPFEAMDDPTKAIVQFYDKNGKMVKSFNGEGFMAMKGFVFSTKNLEIGIVGDGMDYGPFFEENGKSYDIDWFRE